MVNLFLSLEKPSSSWGTSTISFKEEGEDLNAYLHVDSYDDLSKIQLEANKLSNATFPQINLAGDHWNVDSAVAFNKGIYKTHGKKVEVTYPKFTDKEQIKFENLIDNINFTRDLINEQAETLTPHALVIKAKKQIITNAQKVGKENALSFELIEGEKLAELGINGIYTVGRGSKNKPAYLKVDFNPTGDQNAPVSASLVGKGITFDTGGYNLKPGDSMFTMRSDMGGAGLLTGVFSYAISQGLNKRVKLYLCCAENFVSSNAFRPSDIITYRNGVSIEVGNTDAEGRLVLADGLIDASNDNPGLIIDGATLTGSAKAAVGTDYHSVLSIDDNAIEQLLNSAKKYNEKFWRLPFEEFHRSQIKTSFADISNTGSVVQSAGASTATAFLSYFVTNYKKNWLHFDLSASFNRRSGSQWAIGATAIGLETLADLISK